MNETKKKVMEDMLEHHGILGQRWGKRNGPPYPLEKSARSSKERKLNGNKYLNSIKDVKANIVGGGGAVKDEEEEEWEKKLKEDLERLLEGNPDIKFDNIGDFKAYLEELGLDTSKYSKDDLGKMLIKTNRIIDNAKLNNPNSMSNASKKIKEDMESLVKKNPNVKFEDMQDFETYLEELGMNPDKMSNDQKKQLFRETQQMISRSNAEGKQKSVSSDSKKVDEEIARLVQMNPYYEFEDKNDFIVTLYESGVDADKYSQSEIDSMYKKGRATLNAYKKQRLSSITSKDLDRLMGENVKDRRNYNYAGMNGKIPIENVKRTIAEKEQEFQKLADHRDKVLAQERWANMEKENKERQEKLPQPVKNVQNYVNNVGKVVEGVTNTVNNISSDIETRNKIKEAEKHIKDMQTLTKRTPAVFTEHPDNGSTITGAQYIKYYEDQIKELEKKLKHSYDFSDDEDSLEHHGVEGQKWGVQNGPPYPLSRGARVKKYLKDRLKNAAQEHEDKVKKRKAEREEDRLTRRAEREEDRLEKRAAKKAADKKAAENAREAEVRKKSVDEMTDEELIYMIDRKKIENKFQQLMAESQQMRNSNNSNNNSSNNNSNNQKNDQSNQSSSTSTPSGPKSAKDKVKDATAYAKSIAEDLKPVAETTTGIAKAIREIKDTRASLDKGKTDRVKEALNYAKASSDLFSYKSSWMDHPSTKVEKDLVNIGNSVFSEYGKSFANTNVKDSTVTNLAKKGAAFINKLSE